MFKESGLQINNLEKKKADNYELPQSSVLNTEESDQSFEMVKENSQKKDTQEIEAIREEIDLMQQTEKEQVVTPTPKIIPEQKNSFQSIFKKMALAVGITSALAGKIEATNSNLEPKNEDKQINKTEQNIETDNKIPENSISWQAAKNETSTTPEGSEGKIEVASPSLNEKLPINGGAIKEIIVYGEKGYKEAQEKQENNVKKYLFDLEKYQQDSSKWIKAKAIYKDSLDAHNFTEGLEKKIKDIKTISAEFENTPEIKHLNSLYKKRNILEKNDSKILELTEVVNEIHKIWDDPIYNNKRDERDKKIEEISNKIEESTYWGIPRDKLDDDISHVDFGTTYKDVRGGGWSTQEEKNKWTPENKSTPNKPLPIKLSPKEFKLYTATHDGWNFYPYFKKPKVPIKPERPNKNFTEKIKYDPTYEGLNMRSLWPTILKQNPNEKIGTLKNLDPLFEQGFTLDEAMTFPQEIKDKYNIDYIYNKIHGENQK